MNCCWVLNREYDLKRLRRASKGVTVSEPAPAADGSNAYVRDMKVGFVPR